jgi:hypothetical protein
MEYGVSKRGIRRIAEIITPINAIPLYSFSLFFLFKIFSKSIVEAKNINENAKANSGTNIPKIHDAPNREITKTNPSIKVKILKNPKIIFKIFFAINVFFV